MPYSIDHNVIGKDGHCTKARNLVSSHASHNENNKGAENYTVSLE